MSKAINGATKIMASSDKQISIPGLQKTLNQYEMENAKMDMVSDSNLYPHIHL